MGAYSSLYGIPDCANSFLLTDLLRKQWGFDGYVVSDGGAIWDILGGHHYASTPEEAAADAVKAGCDLASGNVRRDRPSLAVPENWASITTGWSRGGDNFQILPRAVQEGLISEAQIDAAVSRDLAIRFRLGCFDPPESVPYSKISIADNDTPAHHALALRVAEESLVLLKNNGLLPLDRRRLKRIAVIGPNADSVGMLLSKYSGRASQPVTILDGVRQVAGPQIQVTYARGCPLALRNDNSNRPTPAMLAEAMAVARSADVVIYVGGIDSTLEKEEGRADFQGFHGGDRTRIELPPVQTDLLESLHRTGKPIVFVDCSGSAIAMPWEAQHLPAILQAWYPGEEGGLAVAEALFGLVNPGGRLPITFYRSTADLPRFDDYSMSHRTYRSFTGRPEFAFGFGLSYTRFHYGQLQLASGTVGDGDTIKAAFTVQNAGARAGDEVAQIYFRRVHPTSPGPKQALCGFTRIHLAAGQAVRVALDIPLERFRRWDTTLHRYVVDPGRYDLLVGAASDDIRLRSVITVKDPGR